MKVCGDRAIADWDVVTSEVRACHHVSSFSVCFAPSFFTET